MLAIRVVPPLQDPLHGLRPAGHCAPSSIDLIEYGRRRQKPISELPWASRGRPEMTKDWPEKTGAARCPAAWERRVATRGRFARSDAGRCGGDCRKAAARPVPPVPPTPREGTGGMMRTRIAPRHPPQKGMRLCTI